MNSTKPKFSIVIPTYNCLKLLKQSLESVFLQSVQNFEILVVDNSSTDGTLSYLDSLYDARLRVFKVYNKGVIAISRNIGIKNSVGEWICFLDADDVWYHDKLEVCSEYMNDNVDIIHHNLKIYGKVDFIGRKVLYGRKLTHPALIDLLINGNGILNSSVIVRRSIVKKIGFINESLEIAACEDYHTWLKVANITEQFCYIDRVLGEYYKGDNNTSNQDMSIRSHYATSEFINKLTTRQLTRYRAVIDYTHARYLYSCGNYKDARLYFGKVLYQSTLKLRIKSIYMLILLLIHY
jgi:glycosyltransferase involved in cell wall biosynthesis